MTYQNLHRWMIAPLALCALVAPGEAEACGGTFCDTGPTAMPVDQSGENILFVVDGDSVEAHVQIQYTGDPARFAWVVPMPSIPDVQVSSNQLFQNMLSSTVPTYGFTTTIDSCGNRGVNENTSGDGAVFGGSPPSEPGGPEVVLRKTVGVFDVVVLEGGTATEVDEWLTANQYQTAQNGVELLAPYVQDGFVFAAVKLTAGTGLDEIHPLSFRYLGSEPAIPLRLTAVAATPDMGVRTFFLGGDRVVPTNYKHMVLNPLRIDWANSASNYGEVVSNAADTEGADGHAFATEYAGPSSIVGLGGIYSQDWDASVFETIDPVLIVDELQVQGLASCDPGFCSFTHALVAPLLEEFLPRPAGVSADDYYSCLSCYQAQADLSEWDGPRFAAAMSERIIDPGLHAQDLLARNPYLTRMFTTVSPAEMDVDPQFRAVSGLSDVGLPAMADRRTFCRGLNVMTLPDGREIAMPDANTWPTFPSTMPWVERIEELAPDGTLRVLSDNAQTIDTGLSRSNAEQGYRDGADGGCACSVPGNPSSRSLVAGALTALLAFGWGRRRRRR